MQAEFAQDRKLAIALLISVFLHATLLLTVQMQGVDSDHFGVLPDLRIFIEQPEDRAVEDREIAPTRRAAAPSRLLATTAATSPVEERTAEIDPAQTTHAAIDRISAEAAAASETTSTPSGALSQTEVAPDPIVTTTSANLDTASVPVLTPVLERSPSVEPQKPIAEMNDRERHMLSKQFDKLTRQLANAGQLPAQRSWKYKNRQYSAIVRRLPAVNDMAIERVEVEITTEENGVQLQSRAELKRLAFSHFTQLVDQWDQGVQLHNDEIKGRFHSNSELVLGWDKAAVPRFLGQVTTAARGFTIATNEGRHQRSDIFRGGIETGAHRVELSLSAPSLGVGAGGRNGSVRIFNDDTRIDFYSDGSFGWRSATSHGPSRREVPSTAQTYFVGRRGVTLYVQGVVHGTILVYAPADVVIMGNLRYARDPRSVAASEDYLGLVADGDIVVADGVETGPGDLEVDAALYARRQFIVRHAHDGSGATLNILGSLTAGTMSETEPRYATKVAYDERFERVRPPGFPMTDRYEVTDWARQWVPVDGASRD